MSLIPFAPLYLGISRRARPLQRSSQVAIPAHRPCLARRSLGEGGSLIPFAPFKFLISENRKCFVISAIWKPGRCFASVAAADLKRSSGSRDTIARSPRQPPGNYAGTSRTLPSFQMIMGKSLRRSSARFLRVAGSWPATQCVSIWAFPSRKLV